jgi:hypothetical protein
MKTIKNCLFAFISIFLFSCATVPKPAGDDLFFTVVYGETVSSPVNPEDTLELLFTLVDAEESRLGEFIRGLLYGGQSAEEYAAKITDDLKTTYRLTLEENSEWGFEQSWSYSEEQEVSVTGAYAVITRHSFIYEGGAHPNYSTLYYVIDLETPKTLSLEDIVTEEGRPNFYAFIDRELRFYSNELTDQPLPPGAPLSSGIYFEDSAAPVKIHAGINAYAAIIAPGRSLDFEVAENRQAYLALIEGHAGLQGKNGSAAALTMRDAAEISGESFTVAAGESPAHLLVIEMAR